MNTRERELEQARKRFAEHIREGNSHPLLLFFLEDEDLLLLLSSSTTKNFETVYGFPNFGKQLSLKEQADVTNALRARNFIVGEGQLEVIPRNPFYEKGQDEQPLALFVPAVMTDGTIIITAKLLQKRDDSLPTHTGRELSSQKPSSIVFTPAVNDQGKEVYLCISASQGANMNGITKPGLLLLMQAGVRIHSRQYGELDLLQQVNDHLDIEDKNKVKELKLQAILASGFLEVRESQYYGKIFQYLLARHRQIIFNTGFSQLIENQLLNSRIREQNLNRLRLYLDRLEDYREILVLCDRDERFAKFIGRIRYMLATSGNKDLSKVMDIGMAKILREIYFKALEGDQAFSVFVDQILDTESDDLLDTLLGGVNRSSTQAPNLRSQGQTNRMAGVGRSEELKVQKKQVIEAILKLGQLISKSNILRTNQSYSDPGFNFVGKLAQTIAEYNLQDLEMELTRCLDYYCGVQQMSVDLIPNDLQGKIALVDLLYDNRQAPQMPFANYPPFSHYHQLPPSPYGSQPALPPPASTGHLPGYQTGYYALPAGGPPNHPFNPNYPADPRNPFDDVYLRALLDKHRKLEEELAKKEKKLKEIEREALEKQTIERFKQCKEKGEAFTANPEEVAALSFEGDKWTSDTVYKLAALAAFLSEAKSREDIDSINNVEEKFLLRYPQGGSESSVREMAKLIILYFKQEKMPENQQLNSLLQAIVQYGKLIASENRNNRLVEQTEADLVTEIEQLAKQSTGTQLPTRTQKPKPVTTSVAGRRTGGQSRDVSPASGGISRRRFLKLAGSLTGLGLLGAVSACTAVTIVRSTNPLEELSAVIPVIPSKRNCIQGKVSHFTEINSAVVQNFTNELKAENLDFIQINPNASYLIVAYDTEGLPYIVTGFKGNEIKRRINSTQGGVMKKVHLTDQEFQKIVNAIREEDNKGRQICSHPHYRNIRAEESQFFAVTIEADERRVQFMGNKDFNIPKISREFIQSLREIKRSEVLLVELNLS